VVPGRAAKKVPSKVEGWKVQEPQRSTVNSSHSRNPFREVWKKLFIKRREENRNWRRGDSLKELFPLHSCKKKKKGIVIVRLDCGVESEKRKGDVHKKGKELGLPT